MANWLRSAGRGIWDWLTDARRPGWKAIMRLLCVGGFGWAAVSGLYASDWRMTLIGLLGLLILGFWSHIDKLISTRDIVIGEWLRITKPPDDRPSPAVAGTVRDNFIYLGNHYLRLARPPALPSSGGWVSLTAYEHFAAAHRLTPSILTAVRCMQCLALLGPDDAEMHEQDRALMLTYYDQALWHAERGPAADVRDRMSFVTWVTQRKSARWEPDFPTKLRRALRQLDM